MLLCECAHRDHDDESRVTPAMIRNADHRYRAGIPTELAFRLKCLPGKIGAQAAICAHCQTGGH